MPIRALREFIKLESASGIILFFVAILALIVDNTPLATFYQTVFNEHIFIRIDGISFQMPPVILWINDGLMVLFFLLVGLEIKREVIRGELNSLAKVSLPAFAAIGGMLAPAIIYVLVNHNYPVALRGWAIPTATDIAFALALLGLLGSRVNTSLKIFLTALAIFDDIGAIFIIAVFYTLHISFLALAFVLLFTVILWLLNHYRVMSLWPYLLFGVALWLSMLLSGIHAVLAGVILALTIPTGEFGETIVNSPLRRLEHRLHPWVAFGILPIFGFANAGVSFAGATLQNLFNHVTLGIIAGLFIGKQLGVLLASWLATKTGLIKLPQEMSWPSLYGIAVLCGVGFTMSLFIGGLAFEGIVDEYVPMVRLGVIVGSFLSGITGYLILRYTLSVKLNSRS